MWDTRITYLLLTMWYSGPGPLGWRWKGSCIQLSFPTTLFRASSTLRCPTDCSHVLSWKFITTRATLMSLRITSARALRAMGSSYRMLDATSSQVTWARTTSQGLAEQGSSSMTTDSPARLFRTSERMLARWVRCPTLPIRKPSSTPISSSLTTREEALLNSARSGTGLTTQLKSETQLSLWFQGLPVNSAILQLFVLTRSGSGCCRWLRGERSSPGPTSQISTS